MSLQLQLLLLLLLGLWSATLRPVMARECHQMSVNACRGVGYSMTTKANQREVAIEMEAFTPLINYGCSARLSLLLCSVYSPMCSPKWPHPIGPCRQLCQEVRNSCERVLMPFGFVWPSKLECSQFPVRSSEEVMCISSHKAPAVRPPIGSTTTSTPPRPVPPVMESTGQQEHTETEVVETDPPRGGPSAGSGRPTPRPTPRPKATQSIKWPKVDSWRLVHGQTPHSQNCNHLRDRDRFVYVNLTGRCAMLCEGTRLFTDEDRQLAQVWIGALSALCAVSSLATILTFLIDRSRFKYPLRPVVFMSMCYLFYSLSHFVRLGAGREAAACEKDPVSGKMVLMQAGLDNTNCAIVFLLQYFFSTAASAWYVILVLTWLLQAGWKWSPEAVARRSCYFHLPAWIVPVGLTVCVLIVRRVEADELFGLCNVGSFNRDTLFTFVIVPNCIFLLLEVFFLLAGIVAMVKVRRHAKMAGQQTNKFDVLMVKIGLFSAMYIIPTASITGFNIYEYCVRDLWYMPGSPYEPSVAALLIKAFASLAIGLTAALWICGAKTVATWRDFIVPGRRRQQSGFPKAAYHSALAESQPGQVSISPSLAKQQQHQQLQMMQQQQQQQQQQQLLGSGRFGSDKSQTMVGQHVHMQPRQNQSAFL